jgi:hypothetical protein
LSLYARISKNLTGTVSCRNNSYICIILKKHVVNSALDNYINVICLVNIIFDQSTFLFKMNKFNRLKYNITYALVYDRKETEVLNQNFIELV